MPKARSAVANVQTTPAAPTGAYSTTFPLTENPISEGGNWTNTISGSFNAPVVTSGGNATGPSSTGFNDSIAMLTGTYGRDQTITATAYRGGSSGAAEIELHLRMAMFPNGIGGGSPGANEIQTYEVDLVPSSGGLELVKWNGPQGTFTNLQGGFLVGGVINDGDVFEVSAIGPAGSTAFVVKQNGTTILTYTDTSAFTAGNPGIGFDAGTPGDGANLGWRDYSVVTS